MPLFVYASDQITDNVPSGKHCIILDREIGFFDVWWVVWRRVWLFRWLVSWTTTNLTWNVLIIGERRITQIDKISEYDRAWCKYKPSQPRTKSIHSDPKKNRRKKEMNTNKQTLIWGKFLRAYLPSVTTILYNKLNCL